MKLARLTSIDRSATRLSEIISVLAKYGLADWLRRINYEWLQQQFTSSEGQRIADLSQEARIRMALTELGTTFIKLGQMLSTRADLVGPELATELKKLQSNTPPDDPQTVEATVDAELGAPPASLYAEFEEGALASASIGQVHRARLSSGESVVVKVQHAASDATVRRDLEIMQGLAELAERHASQLRAYQPIATTAEFRRTLLRELDFTRERRNLQQFSQNFADNEHIHFPTVYPDLSSQRVLTMEYVEGISLSDREQLLESGADLNEVALRGANMYLDMIFRDGFYHADPHPGNLMLLTDGALGVLDCGMVGRIDEQLREDFEGMLLAAVDRDAEELTDTIVRLGSVPPDFDRNALRAEIGEFLADFVGQSLADFDLSGALTTITEIIRRFRIILPASGSMLLKVLVMLEGTSRQLDPQFSLAELMRPYYHKAARRRFAPQQLLQRTRRAFRDWERLLDAFPRDAADVMSRIRSGTFDVNLQHRRLDSTVNRLVMGILAAALFVGSALLWSHNVPPSYGDYSVPGAAGCVVAVTMGWQLWRAIKRSGDIQQRD